MTKKKKKKTGAESRSEGRRLACTAIREFEATEFSGELIKLLEELRDKKISRLELNLRINQWVNLADAVHLDWAIKALQATRSQ